MDIQGDDCALSLGDDSLQHPGIEDVGGREDRESQCHCANAQRDWEGHMARVN